MPHIFDYDLHRTHSYIPKISLEPYLPPDFVESFRTLESRYIHEGRAIDPSYVVEENLSTNFQIIGLESLLTLNESICPRFVLEFFSVVKIKRDQNYSIHLRCRIGRYEFHVSLEQFAQILNIPCHGQCAYSEETDLTSLMESGEDHGPYKSYIPTPTELINVLCNSPDVLYPNRIRTCELRYYLQPMAVILRENALSLVKDRECIPASVAHMLYCIITRQQYNLAYLFAMRIMHLKDDSNKSMPYGMLLTRLFNYFMETYPHLQDNQYHMVNRVMEPITESRITSFLRPERFRLEDQGRRIEED